MSVNKRNSSFELMRIISMILICAFHWQLHGNNDGIITSQLCANQIFSFCIGSWGVLGVNLFFLLSFYFMIKNQETNYKKIWSMIIKVSFYGSAVLFIASICGVVKPDLIDKCKSFLGVFAYQYWFITVYLIISIVAPFINKMMGMLSKKESFILCTVMFYVTYIVSWSVGSELVGRLSCGLSIYVFIYTLENKIDLNIFERLRGGSILLISAGTVVEIILSYMGNNINPIFFKLIEKIQTTNSPYMLILSLFVFYSFKNFNIKTNKTINFLGKYSVGAYLLHGGAGFIKDYLWDGLFEADKYFIMSFFDYAVHYVLCVGILFIVGIICELVYSHTIDRLAEKVLGRFFL